MLRDRDLRIFLDVNPALFLEVLDCLNDFKITPTVSTLGNSHGGEEGDIFIQKLLLAFGLEDDSLVHLKKYVSKSKVRQVKLGNNVHSKPSQDKCKTMNFNHFPNAKSQDIHTDLENKQKAHF